MLLRSSGLDVIQALFAKQGIEGEGAHHLTAFFNAIDLGNNVYLEICKRFF